MNTLLTFFRLYFRTLARFAPRVAGRQAFRLFSTPRLRRPVPAELESVMTQAEHFDVEVEGHRVAAYRWAGVNGAQERVMLVHGWESRAGRLAVWVQPLLDAGYEVVAFDAPAHGASAGRRTSPLAFSAAVHTVVDRVGPVTACVSHSLGGLATLLAVGGGELLPSREGLAVKRLVILAGAESGVDAMAMFCDTLGLGSAFLPLILAGAAEAAGRPVTDLDGHRVFADHPVPTLWLHDPDDTMVPFEAAERVARVCPHVNLERVTGLGHNRIARDPAMIRRGLDFLAALSHRAAVA